MKTNIISTVRTALILVLFLLCLSGCSGADLSLPEQDIPTGTFIGEDGQEMVRIPISIGGSQFMKTRGFSDGYDESRGVGVCVLIFYNSAGETGAMGKEEAVYLKELVIPQKELSFRTYMDIPLRPVLNGATYWFYVYGNMPSGSGNLSLGHFWNLEQFRTTVTDFKSSAYRYYYSADGQPPSQRAFNIFTRYGYQDSFATYDQIEENGIPYGGCIEGIRLDDNVGSLEPISIECKRLFAKVNLTVDHSALLDSEGYEMLWDYGQVTVHNVSSRVPTTFGENAEPIMTMDVDELINWQEEEVDPNFWLSNIYPVGWDHDKKEIYFTFYVPENRQEIPGFYNDDSLQKNPDYIGSDSERLTYIEYTNRIDHYLYGVGGDVTYRFYLGKNIYDDFDVEGGCEYNIRLGFKKSTLTQEGGKIAPVWKVDYTPDTYITPYITLSETNVLWGAKETGTKYVSVLDTNIPRSLIKYNKIGNVWSQGGYVFASSKLAVACISSNASTEERTATYQLGYKDPVSGIFVPVTSVLSKQYGIKDFSFEEETDGGEGNNDF